jgi:hypothetical protein
METIPDATTFDIVTEQLDALGEPTDLDRRRIAAALDRVSSKRSKRPAA